mgnify:CR=1 FL=1
MLTTLAALRALHDELGGPATLWLGYSTQHGWVLLDRTLEQNRPGGRTDQLTFERLKDWSEVEVARCDWDAMIGLTPYGRQTIDPPALSCLIERLYGWRKTRDERALSRSERQRKEEQARLAARQAKYEQDNLPRIRATPYNRRDRADALLLLRRELKDQQASERAAIEAIVRERSIQFLIHFTSIRNLPSILTNGLLPRHTLASRGVEFHHNDELRMEGLTEATSLSIGFPNYLMLFKQINQARGDSFCLLALDPRVLWELPCLFSPGNAARRTFSEHKEHLEPYTGVKALARMFEGGEANRKLYGLPPYYTTDPQAEVLVVHDIPSTHIKGVVLPRLQDLQRRTALVELAAAAGVADMTETHRSWFGKRPDDAARWVNTRPAPNTDTF